MHFYYKATLVILQEKIGSDGVDSSELELLVMQLVRQL
jgi:hypothetical protein